MERKAVWKGRMNEWKERGHGEYCTVRLRLRYDGGGTEERGKETIGR